MKQRFIETNQFITEVGYNRVEIRLFIDGEDKSRTFSIMEDSRLSHLKPMRKPLDETKEWEWMEWSRDMDMRKRQIDALAAKIAYSLYQSFESLDK